MKIIKGIGIAILLVAFFYSCQTLKQITQTLTNLQRCQFKLENVNGFQLAGVNLSNKGSLSDFSITDGLKLTKAFGTKKFPADFILNVAARNPNDGSGGTKQTSATLTGMDWRLFIDEVKTIEGNIDKSVEIPGTGQSSIIPLRMSLDLYEFFGKQGYDGIVNLALALGGVKGSAAKIKLDAIPTVSTPLGDIAYPGRITIVDKEFRE